MNDGLVAFWKYYTGQYTTYKSGVIETFTSDGKVKVKRYPGFSFIPVLIISNNEVCRNIQKKLIALENDFMEDVKRAKEELNKNIESLHTSFH